MSRITMEYRETAHNEETPQAPKEKKEGFFGEIIRFTFFALIIVIPVRMFIAQPFIVQGESMYPTFTQGEYLIVDQVTYRFEDVRRGDVIVFRYPEDPKKFFIKRVIAVPGDIITITGSEVRITNKEHPEGILLKEPYVRDMRPDTQLSQTLGEHEYFVMGDNRNASSDSRVWGILRDDLIIGRAFLRLLPIQNIDALPGVYHNYQ